MTDLILYLQHSHTQNSQQSCQQFCGNGRKCPQEAMEEISSLEVGSLESAIVVAVREGGGAHILKTVTAERQREKSKFEI